MSGHALPEAADREPDGAADAVTSGVERLARAALSVALLAVDPAGLGGLHLRGRVGPVRDAFTGRLGILPLPLRKLHPGVSDTALMGGVDLAATLGAGRIVRQAGLLEARAALVLGMGERCPPDLAAKLAHALDGGLCLVAVDEGVEADERLPAALAERLAFAVDLDGIGWHTPLPDPPDAEALVAARTRLAGVAMPRDAAQTLAVLAARFGIDSLRAPLFARAAARAHAALEGHASVTEDDLRIAVELVYPTRATMMPESTETPEQPPEETDSADQPDQQDPSEPPKTQESETPALDQLPDEMLVDAVAALLPRDLLERLKSGRATRAAKGSGAGARRQGNRRGRPLPPRPGRLDGRARIDLVATLRAAAPWQTIRACSRPDWPGLHIRPADIRLKRFEDTSDRLLIFTVDASGSAAMARLSEAKGAIEILLGEAYARRDHVALIAFRGAGAEALLPPTRSLVQTKRRLAGLPGGGATPLAAGLGAAAEMAAQAARHGLTPTVALLTDGRANVALDGGNDRAAAAEDAARMGRALRAAGVPALVLDTAARPQRALAALAVEMGARYLPLPRADAARMSTAIGAALAGG